MRALLLLGITAAACRTPGAFTPRADGVEVRDELGPLLRDVRAAPDDRAAGEAWSKALGELGLPVEGVKPEALGKAIRASVPQLEGISASGPSEVREVASAVGGLHGRSVTARVTLVALRDDAALLTRSGVILLNARSPLMADERARRAVLARQLSASLLPDAGSLGPLASAVYFRSLTAAAALAVAPGAPTSALTGRSEEEIARLRPRLPLLARELLASLDSAAPSQVERFFGTTGSDPLLPRGSGELVCAELGAALIRISAPPGRSSASPRALRRAASRALQQLAAAP